MAAKKNMQVSVSRVLQMSENFTPPYPSIPMLGEVAGQSGPAYGTWPAEGTEASQLTRLTAESKLAAHEVVRKQLVDALIHRAGFEPHMGKVPPDARALIDELASVVRAAIEVGL